MAPDPMPQVVWALQMFDPPAGVDPELLTGDDPWRPGGVLLGVFATRAAAMTELLAWSSVEEVETMTWTTPGPDPEYQELRGTLEQHWFSLGPEVVSTGPTEALPFLERPAARRHPELDD